MIAMVESQHSHRQELEKHVIHANISAQRVGTMLGFIVAVASLVGAPGRRAAAVAVAAASPSAASCSSS